MDLEEEMCVRTAERGRADAEESSAMVPGGRGRQTGGRLCLEEETCVVGSVRTAEASLRVGG